MAILEQRMDRLDSRMDRLDIHMDGVDGRLRAVETTLSAVSAKVDLLATQIVAKLPSWRQMPIVIAATATLLSALYAGLHYMQAQGLQ